MKGSIQRLVLLTPESFQSFVRTPVKDSHILDATDDTETSTRGDGETTEPDYTSHSTQSVRSTYNVPTMSDTSPSSAQARHYTSSSTSQAESTPERALNSAVRSSLGGLDALFLHDLYFVTRDGEIDGMHSKQKDWALGAISRDPRVDVDLSDEEVLKEIRTEMLFRKQHSLSTMEMLHLYKEYDIQNQICLVGKFDT